MNTEKLIQDIIKEQSNIIGSSLAQKMAISSGAVELANGNIKLTKDGEQALQDVILAYEKLFGVVSVKVCFNVIDRHDDPSTRHIKQTIEQRINEK